MSKGDNVRPHNKERFDENFEAVFGKKELKTWNPGEDDEQEKRTQTEPTSEGGSQWEASSPTPCNADPSPEDFQPGSRQTQESGD